MKLSYLFFFLFLGQAAFGQIPVVNPTGAGLGHATVGLQHASAIFSNQSGLVGLNKLAVVAAAERRFMLSELQSAAIGVALPTRSGTFGFQAQSFGYEDFKQQKLGLAYARKLWSVVAVSAQFNYFQTRIPEYGNRGIISFEAGAQAKLSKTVTIGAHIQNPAQVEVTDSEVLPTILRLGLVWEASEKLLIASEIEKDLDFPFRWKTGVDYQPKEPLHLRVGFATEPAMMYFGMGFSFGKGIQADMSGSFHQTLGFSPGAAVLWN